MQSKANVSLIANSTPCSVCINAPSQKWITTRAHFSVETDTAGLAVDLGSGDHPLLATSNQCVPVKNTLGGSAIELCACEIIKIFSVVSCVVRVLYRFHYILVTKETPNKW
jgi:hypothetical protein